MLFLLIGRLLSGVHWFTDVIGSIFIGIGLLNIYDKVFTGCVMLVVYSYEANGKLREIEQSLASAEAKIKARAVSNGADQRGLDAWGKMRLSG